MNEPSQTLPSNRYYTIKLNHLSPDLLHYVFYGKYLEDKLLETLIPELIKEAKQNPVSIDWESELDEL